MKVKLNGIANEELFTPGAEYVVQEFFLQKKAICAFLKEGYWELIE